MKEIDPVALFRLSVLGPLASRERLGRGELQQIIRELARGGSMRFPAHAGA
jgi:putative transposase